MDINYLIGMLIIVSFCLLGYTHLEHLSNEVIYITDLLIDSTVTNLLIPNKIFEYAFENIL